jgi:hypothetical protein
MILANLKRDQNMLPARKSPGRYGKVHTFLTRAMIPRTHVPSILFHIYLYVISSFCFEIQVEARHMDIIRDVNSFGSYALHNDSQINYK